MVSTKSNHRRPSKLYQRTSIMHHSVLTNSRTLNASAPIITTTLYDDHAHKLLNYLTTRMWANAQRDGRPAKYTWRPLFNAAKFGWRALLECRAVTLPRRETPWKLQGCPKLANRSQPLVGQSSPYYQDMWRRYCCLTSFFQIVDTWLSSEDIARRR